MLVTTSPGRSRPACRGIFDAGGMTATQRTFFAAASTVRRNHVVAADDRVGVAACAVISSGS